MKYERLLSYKVRTYIRVYREEEYVLVQYAMYLLHQEELPHLRELNQRIFVTLRAAHFERCSFWGIESRTVVDADFRSS